MELYKRNVSAGSSLPQRVAAALEGKLDPADLSEKEAAIWLDRFTEKMGKPGPEEEKFFAKRRAAAFAEVLALAASVMGSEEAAREWITKPVIGLDYQNPADLIETPAGTDAVKEYLMRLEYGVYT